MDRIAVYIRQLTSKRQNLPLDVLLLKLASLNQLYG